MNARKLLAYGLSVGISLGALAYGRATALPDCPEGVLINKRCTPWDAAEEAIGLPRAPANSIMITTTRDASQRVLARVIYRGGSGQIIEVREVDLDEPVSVIFDY